jgi:hypothetical protein
MKIVEIEEIKLIISWNFLNLKLIGVIEEIKLISYAWKYNEKTLNKINKKNLDKRTRLLGDHETMCLKSERREINIQLPIEKIVNRGSKL